MKTAVLILVSLFIGGLAFAHPHVLHWTVQTGDHHIESIVLLQDEDQVGGIPLQDDVKHIKVIKEKEGKCWIGNCNITADVFTSQWCEVFCDNYTPSCWQANNRIVCGELSDGSCYTKFDMFCNFDPKAL